MITQFVVVYQLLKTGKEMQFFGARANLAKCLTYAINGGIDEKTKDQVAPKYRPNYF